MNETENFESLRQLLALKRHEIPPPGYFDRFSGNVIARIRSGETASGKSWFVRIFEALEVKPAFAGAFASAVCLLMLFGIVYAGSDNSAPQSLFQPGAENSQLSPQLASASPQQTATPEIHKVFASDPTNFEASLQPVASAFGGNPIFEQVSFSAGQ
ncbi:MAG TPA: hypothetical protein VFV23_07685 [Verrucomicrobiae bacterium]|nr:hypothetical protein [Verrucomicrobiae bacterium]